MNEHAEPQPVTADPPEPPMGEDSADTPAAIVDAMEKRVFAEKGNPAEEAEPEPAEEEPGEEPPE